MEEEQGKIGPIHTRQNAQGKLEATAVDTNIMIIPLPPQEVLELLKNDAERTYANYETMLNEKYDGSTIDENKKGLARELARMNLTLNTYTQWYWKTDLLNLMNFLRLRADSHAQYEIRVYADIMLDTVKKWVPTTYDAFMDYRVGGTEVSEGKIVEYGANHTKLSESLSLTLGDGETIEDYLVAEADLAEIPLVLQGPEGNTYAQTDENEFGSETTFFTIDDEENKQILQ